MSAFDDRIRESHNRLFSGNDFQLPHQISGFAVLLYHEQDVAHIDPMQLLTSSVHRVYRCSSSSQLPSKASPRSSPLALNHGASRIAASYIVIGDKANVHFSLFTGISAKVAVGEQRKKFRLHLKIHIACMGLYLFKNTFGRGIIIVFSTVKWGVSAYRTELKRMVELASG